MKIQFFDDKLEKFIRTLEKVTVAKVLRTIDLLERFGYQLEMPHSKKIDNRLFELRVRGTQEVRIFYTFYKDGMVLLHGYIKKTERIPERELSTAQKKLKALDKI